MDELWVGVIQYDVDATLKYKYLQNRDIRDDYFI